MPLPAGGTFNTLRGVPARPAGPQLACRLRATHDTATAQSTPLQPRPSRPSPHISSPILNLALPPLPLSAIHYGPDDEGINGIYLGLDVVTEASRGLTQAMNKVGRGGRSRWAGGGGGPNLMESLLESALMPG